MLSLESGYSFAWKIKLDFLMMILGAPVTMTFFFGAYYELGGGGIVLRIFFSGSAYSFVS
jgi:hypothetical protein